MLAINNDDLYDRLVKKDKTVLRASEAEERTVRPLHLGFVNIMPDKAFKVTETQFLTPIHQASGPLQVMPIGIKLSGIDYGGQQDYVDKNYITLEQAKDIGIDIMIVTGANVPAKDLQDAPFYEPLKKVIEFSKSGSGPTSTLYSCLASHAYMDIVENQTRQKLDQKLWGNFEHWVTNVDHPLTNGLSTTFNLPHSRGNQITWEQIVDSNMKILAYSDDAGVLMATSPDGLRAVLLQGHPEYGAASLQKEWKRDLGQTRLKQVNEEDINLPPFPQNYFEGRGLELAEKIVEDVKAGEYDDQLKSNGGRLTIPGNIDKQILFHTPNPYASVRNNILSNWISAVFDVTHADHNTPFMDHIDPDNVFDLPQDQPLYSPTFLPE